MAAPASLPGAVYPAPPPLRTRAAGCSGVLYRDPIQRRCCEEVRFPALLAALHLRRNGQLDRSWSHRRSEGAHEDVQLGPRRQCLGPQAIFRNDKFYLYCPLLKDGRMTIGVAVSDSPTGPFTDPIRKPLISNQNSKDDIDPSVFVDDDGQAYLYWGHQRLFYVKLNADRWGARARRGRLGRLEGWWRGTWRQWRWGWHHRRRPLEGRRWQRELEWKERRIDGRGCRLLLLGRALVRNVL